MAPMGYRYIGDTTDDSVVSGWRNRTLAVGGMFPVLIADGPDTMDVNDGRGTMLIWQETSGETQTKFQTITKTTMATNIKMTSWDGIS